MKMQLTFFTLLLLSPLASACAASALSASVKKDIQTQMTSAEKPIAFCYENALKKAPNLHGKMMVKFKVAETSRAFTSIEVESSDFKEPELERCVILETSELRLKDPPEVPIAVTYPLDFSAARE